MLMVASSPLKSAVWAAVDAKHQESGWAVAEANLALLIKWRRGGPPSGCTFLKCCPGGGGGGKVLQKNARPRQE